MKYEYAINEYPFSEDKTAIIDAMNASGSEGWELVNVLPVNKVVGTGVIGGQPKAYMAMLCFFKRPALPVPVGKLIER